MRTPWLDWFIDLAAFFAFVLVVAATLIAGQAALHPGPHNESVSQGIVAWTMLVVGITYTIFYVKRLASFAGRKGFR